ncbi:DNA-directed RNA polymerase subunit omega [candidate division KSB1 bacterium]|nr:DNA-directed RNA polymerase subunit omega [candidate division KSB1 bacterium]
MISTISLEELEKHAGSVYEAIVIIAKRANQINDMQKKMIEAETAMVESESEEFDEEMINPDLVDRQYLKLPKPTTVALQEMLEGKLQGVSNKETAKEQE